MIMPDPIDRKTLEDDEYQTRGDEPQRAKSRD